MVTPDDPRIPALQLLLGSADGDEIKQLFTLAFGNLCVPRTDASILKRHLEMARAAIEGKGPYIKPDKYAAGREIRICQGIIGMNIA